MSASIDDFKTFHWLSHVTCFHCQTEAFTAVLLQRWNYRSVRVTTDFYRRVLKFEKVPDVTSHKPNQSYTEPIVAVRILFWHKILIPNFKGYCHEGLRMSQNTGSHKNSLNLLGEKYLNESHWPMHRIRLFECRAYFIELPSTFK